MPRNRRRCGHDDHDKGRRVDRGDVRRRGVAHPQSAHLTDDDGAHDARPGQLLRQCPRWRVTETARPSGLFVRQQVCRNIRRDPLGRPSTLPRRDPCRRAGHILGVRNYTGRTSMEIGIRVDTERIAEQTTRHTNSSYFTMVAVDADGNPRPVPPLPLTSELERQRYEAARARRRALAAAFAAPHGVPPTADPPRNSTDDSPPSCGEFVDRGMSLPAG